MTKTSPSSLPHVRPEIDSTAKPWRPSDRLVASTRTISLLSRYKHGAWTYHNRLLGSPRPNEKRAWSLGHLGRVEAGWTRNAERNGSSPRVWAGAQQGSPKANYSCCLVDPQRTRAPLQVTE